ncbi:OmpA family protein [Sphingomonas sp.]|uniref:OmpA family protein n=1 Tax=Sphingomonas sp. TaxID=28214 RepID=UPI003B3BB51C
MRLRYGLQAAMLMALVASTSGCSEKAAASSEQTAKPAPRKISLFHPRKKEQLPKPSPTAHLILLPDSAISVERGSTEEKLAAFLKSDRPAPNTFRFTGTEFAPWQTNPNPGTLRTMYAVAQILRAYPNSRVTLVGHTDNDGTPEQNLALSRARVQRMADLLIRSGIQERRITIDGRGMTQPIADNATPAGRAQNRRIELIVTAK